MQYLYNLSYKPIWLFQAFLNGKMKVKGNIMLGQKLSVLFQEQAKL